MPRSSISVDGNKAPSASWDDAADSILLDTLHKASGNISDNGFKGKTWAAVAEALKDHRNGGAAAISSSSGSLLIGTNSTTLESRS